MIEQIAFQEVVDTHDKYSCLQNIQISYKLKVNKFKLYYKTHFNNKKSLIYQVTTTKVVEAFLTCNFKSTGDSSETAFLKRRSN